MKAFLFLLLPVLINCTPAIYGSGSSSTIKPSSLSKNSDQVCLSNEEYLRQRKANSRCKVWKKDSTELKKENKQLKEKGIRLDTTNKKLTVDLVQCRVERDVKQKCPANNEKFWSGIGIGAGILVAIEVVVLGVVVVVVFLNK